MLANPENRPHADGFIELAWTTAGLPVAVTLIRTVQDFAADGIGRYGERHKPALGWLERLAGDERRSAAELMTLADAMPLETVALRELAALVTQAAGERLPDDLNAAPERARLANNAAVRLGALGQREAALAAAQQAVDLRRTLAAARPEAFTPDLARSLNNLANRLSDLGQREAALATAQEAVALLAPFFLRLPAAYAQWMAICLRGLLKRLEACGQQPNLAELLPILATFQKLQSPPTDDPGAPS